MTLSEKQLEEILERDVQISDAVNERINDTYKMLERAQKNYPKQTGRKSKRHSYIAAAIAIIACLIVPGAVYAAANSDFFEGMFGNATKKSTPAVTKDIDNGKGGTVSVTIPSHEYVSVDPEKAKDLVGEGSMSKPIEKKLGEHTLRIENFIYDSNSAFMYFTLERKGGVTMLQGNGDTNSAKGAYFAEDELYRFSIETTKNHFAAEKIYIDTEKSTKDKLYCYSYMIWADKTGESDAGLVKGEHPVLQIMEYPCPVAELKEEDYDKIKTEKVTLTEKEPLAVQKVDLGEKGYFEFSPVSISVDLSRGTGISKEDAEDPVNLTHLEIKYKDGSSYIISDAEKNIENSGYVCGVGTMYKTAYDRIVDINEIKEIILNDVTIPVK